MKQRRSLVIMALAIILFAACGPAKGTPKTWTIPDSPFPLSQPGPYFAGKLDFTIVDKTRANREIQVEIWYPAVPEAGAEKRTVKYEAVPDKIGAPYPLILTEHRSGRWIFEDHLVSHGFVMAIITVPDHANAYNWDSQMLNWPRDFLFGLDQIASNPPGVLKGVIDTGRVGVTGYSFGGDISLALAGVRIDPADYIAHCAKRLVIKAKYGGGDGYHTTTCSLADKWGEFSALAGEKLTASSDGLWQPLTDKRIKAVMPMAPSGTWLYGARGLAAADRPLLIIASTEDEFSPYQVETKFLFEHLGTPNKSMITFIGKSHMMALEMEPITRLKHFVTGFFGYHLQDRTEFQNYISQEYVSRFNDLFWGIYPDD